MTLLLLAALSLPPLEKSCFANGPYRGQVFVGSSPCVVVRSWTPTGLVTDAYAWKGDRDEYFGRIYYYVNTYPPLTTAHPHVRDLH